LYLDEINNEIYYSLITSKGEIIRNINSTIPSPDPQSLYELNNLKKANNSLLDTPEILEIIKQRLGGVDNSRLTN
jgi:hypothetical protein